MYEVKFTVGGIGRLLPVATNLLWPGLSVIWTKGGTFRINAASRATIGSAGGSDGKWTKTILLPHGKIVWNHETGEGESIAGILTTAGHLLFKRG
jgi:hypothetical protein